MLGAAPQQTEVRAMTEHPGVDAGVNPDQVPARRVRTRANVVRAC
jgi:hypothetical protein